MRQHYGMLVAVGVALGLAVPLLYGGRETLTLLARVSPAALALMLGMIFIGWNLNAGRLRLLAGGVGVRLGQGRALVTVMATELVMCTTPAGSGGAFVLAWLLERHGLPKSRGLALYTADQFMDMLFFLGALGGLVLYWLFVPSGLHLGWQLGGMAAALAGTMTLVWLFPNHHRHYFGLGGRLLRPLRLSTRLRRRLVRRILKFSRSLRLVKGYPRGRLAAIFLLCSAHWLLRYSVLYLAVAAVGGHVSWGHAFLVQMLSLTAGQATLLPGGGGGTEVSSSLLLAPYLDAATLAAAIVLWRFVTYYWYLIAGAPAFAIAVGKPIGQLAAAGSGLRLKAAGQSPRIDE